MNRITESRNYMAMAVVAVAAMFIVSTGLASADHDVPFGPLVKSTDCPAAIDVKPASAIVCSFTMSYTGGVAATISDTVPAEWQVTDTTGTCDVEQANKKGNKKSATKISCDVAGDGNIVVSIESRASNGKSHVDANGVPTVFKPTSCGDLDINDGAHAVDENGILIASSAPLTPIVVNDPDDTDCDGVANVDDICEGFDDALDEDSDGIPDGCDTFLNDTDNDGVTNDVDTDDDGDGILDVNETPGCELDPTC